LKINVEKEPNDMVTNRFKILLILIVSVLASSLAVGDDADGNAPTQTLFSNVSVFNGSEDRLYENLNVLVEGVFIKAISEDPIETNGDARVIEGQGKTLMPGLIDSHTHIMINGNFAEVERDLDLVEMGVRGAIVAKDFLMDGFTSIRDMGGPAFGVARSVASGRIPGPRIYPAGAFISQTSGHGDFRDRSDAGFSANSPGDLSNFERFGIGTVADGVPAVLKATRLNLRHGATQIKIMAGGGGSSKYDPIDTTQYSIEEVCAAVEAAADWGTYVGAHVFNDRAVNRLLDCGVKTMEHAFFINEKTMKRMAKEGAFAAPQMWGLSPELAQNPLMPPAKIPLVEKLAEQDKDVGRKLVKNKVKVVFSADWVGEISDANRSRRYEIYWRTQMFGSNFEVLKQLTSTGGEVLALSGPRNPAPGRLGVVEVGAVADLLLVDGNPLEDISVIGGRENWYAQPDPATHPIETLEVIMKEGVIYKDSL
jgi:imidazolonepropionase-like amidohydrolase